MFTNFIYFIVVLLIYTTYLPSEEPRFGPVLSGSSVLFLGLIFSLFVAARFHRLKQRIDRGENFVRLDHQYNALMNRLSIAAIVLFGINIYGLNLVESLALVPIFAGFPTLQAVCCLLVFVAYLSVIWYFAYPAYRQLYGSRVSRRSYVLSNISFSVPVLIPWLVLSGIADLIQALPFETPKRWLETTPGQALFILLFLILVAVTVPVLVQKFWRCRPMERGYHRSRIEALCRRAGIQYRDILYWPIFEGRMITAGVMGLVKRFRYILVTEALLEVLRPEEVEAVIAHEIGHVKRNHLLFYLLFFIGYILLSYAVFDLVIYFIIYTEPLYRFVLDTGFSQAAVTSTLFTMVTILIVLVYFRYVFGYFMRNFERQADCYVYSLFDTAGPLISTFEKITLTSGQSPDKPNWHHFSIRERVEYLLKCERDKRWIFRQDRKIRKSIALYVSAVLVIGVAGYHLNYGEVGKRLSTDFFEKIIQRELQSNPQDPELYTFLGDLYYHRAEHHSAAEAYEKAIQLSPGKPDAHPLNNLAWLYATSEKEDLRNPRQALALAKRAAELSREPHVLDTLAESYFVNGQYRRAVAAGEEALSRSKGDRAHFIDQLEKFRKALNRSGPGRVNTSVN